MLFLTIAPHASVKPPPRFRIWIRNKGPLEILIWLNVIFAGLFILWQLLLR